MGSRAGLKKVVKSVRGKKGTVRRTYWVRTKEAVKGAGRFLNKHKGKIAAGAALAGAAALAAKHRGAIGGAARGAYSGVKSAHALGKRINKPANMLDYLLRAVDYGVGTVGGALIGGRVGHQRDKARHEANATARQQAKNRRDFVVSGLKEAAGQGLRRLRGRLSRKKA